MTALFNASLPQSMAANLATTETDLATAFKCQGDGTLACTYEELTMMQWTSGMITDSANWPASVKTTDEKILKSSKSVTDSEFQAKPSEFDELFMRPEIHYYVADPVSVDAAWKLFDRANMNSLDQKWRATLVTDFVMTRPTSPDNVQLLQSIYGIADFYKFFDGTRNMVQEYLLGGAWRDYSPEEIVLGYNETRWQYIFQNQTDMTFDFFQGNDIDVETYVSPVLSVKSPRVTQQTVSMFTGSNQLDHVARVRFMNMKDYINVNSPIFDGTQIT